MIDFNNHSNVLIFSLLHVQQLNFFIHLLIYFCMLKIRFLNLMLIFLEFNTMILIINLHFSKLLLKILSSMLTYHL